MLYTIIGSEIVISYVMLLPVNKNIIQFFYILTG